MEIPIYARHLFGATFLGRGDCALSRACKEAFKTGDVDAGVETVTINNIIYNVIGEYKFEDFKSDYHAAFQQLEDQLIRTITIEKV